MLLSSTPSHSHWNGVVQPISEMYRRKEHCLDYLKD